MFSFKFIRFDNDVVSVQPPPPPPPAATLAVTNFLIANQVASAVLSTTAIVSLIISVTLAFFKVILLRAVKLSLTSLVVCAIPAVEANSNNPNNSFFIILFFIFCQLIISPAWHQVQHRLCLQR